MQAKVSRVVFLLFFLASLTKASFGSACTRVQEMHILFFFRSVGKKERKESNKKYLLKFLPCESFHGKAEWKLFVEQAELFLSCLFSYVKNDTDFYLYPSRTSRKIDIFMGSSQQNIWSNHKQIFFKPRDLTSWRVKNDARNWWCNC